MSVTARYHNLTERDGKYIICYRSFGKEGKGIVMESTPFLGKYAKNLAITESNLGDSLLIFENGGDNVHVLNITGKIIWNSIERADTTRDDVKANLSAWFGSKIDEDAASRVIEEFVDQLLKAGLLVLAAQGGFQVGKEVSVKPNKDGAPFQEPQLRTYTKDWLKNTHRAAFDTVLFSDSWGPSSPNVLGA
jgi:hypothetical protein